MGLEPFFACISNSFLQSKLHGFNFFFVIRLLLVVSASGLGSSSLAKGDEESDGAFVPDDSDNDDYDDDYEDANEGDEGDETNDKRQMCSFGAACFRKNPQHFKVCSHVFSVLRYGVF